MKKSPVKSSSTSDLSIDKQDASFDSKSVSDDDLCDADPEPFKLYNFLFRRHLYLTGDKDKIATKRSVFDDSTLAHHYHPKADYENLHRFDIKARWTRREEAVSSVSLSFSTWIFDAIFQALVRKIDWKVMLWGE